jgi:hypothetical protein
MDSSTNFEIEKKIIIWFRFFFSKELEEQREHIKLLLKRVGYVGK